MEALEGDGFTRKRFVVDSWRHREMEASLVDSCRLLMGSLEGD